MCRNEYDERVAGQNIALQTQTLQQGPTTGVVVTAVLDFSVPVTICPSSKTLCLGLLGPAKKNALSQTLYCRANAMQGLL